MKIMRVRQPDGSLIDIPIGKGATGDTPRLQVGEVHTVEPTDNAFVEINSSDKLNPILSFGIPRGETGKSAYQVAVDNGFSGDENDWLNSLRPEIAPNIFGVAWDGGESTKLTRLHPDTDPNGIVTVSITDEPVAAVGQGMGSSPFDEYYPWKGMREYNIKDNIITYSQ